MTLNPERMASDIRALQLELQSARNETAILRQDLTITERDVQQINITGQEPSQVENWIDNGNFDFTTDAYDNAVPVPGDTQEEAARWYAQVTDPSARVLDGAITTGTPSLTSATGGFLVGDVGSQIVVEGAGAAGANLVTTIAVFVSANAVDLTANAGTTVTAATVRWRLQTLVTSSPLRTAAHSGYATLSDPDFDKVNGFARIGVAAYDMATPLAKNFIEASRVCTCAGVYRLNPHVVDAGIDIGVNPNILNSATATFLAGDVGKTVTVIGAGPGGTNLETTISAYLTPTSVALTDAAATTVVAATATFSMTWPTGPVLYGGLWDNTAGRRMFIEGADFTLTCGIVGAPGATTSSEYFVVGLTDFGETVASNKVTVNRPSDGLFVVGSIYEALSWTNLSGILHYDVYRKTGATYHLLDRLDNGETSFFDVGVTSKTVVSYPAGSELRQRCYVEIEEGISTPVTTEWKRFRIVIPVPQTYNKALTTDRQWLRVGLTAALTGAGSARALEVDLVGLNDRDGTFSRSANDYRAAQQTTTTAATGSQGETGTGGTGHDNCPAEDEDVTIIVGGGKEKVIKAIAVKRGMRMLTGNGWFAEVRAVDVGEPEQMLRLYTEAGLEREATPGDVIIQSARDTKGRKLRLMKKGMPVRSYLDGQYINDRVLEITRPRKKKRSVKITLLGNDPTFIAGHVTGSPRGKRGGVVGHNVKPIEGV